MRDFLITIVGAAMLLNGAAATIAQAPVSVPAAPVLGADYTVGQGDILKITVYRATDYDSVVQVAEDGTIPFSVIGKVQVAGLTPAKVANVLATRLQSEGIFKNPIISVLVQEIHSRTVSVLGNVTKPGEFPLERGGLRISDLLARAGAQLGEGTGNVRLVSRDGKTEELLAGDIVSGRQDREVRPGESLIVGTLPVFYIKGEVQHPGSFPVEPDLTVGKAIALAGGLTPRGSNSKIRIIRSGSDNQGQGVKAKQGDRIMARDLVNVGARIF